MKVSAPLLHIKAHSTDRRAEEYFKLYTCVENCVRIRTASCFPKLGWAVYGPSTDGAAPLSLPSAILHRRLK